MVFLNLKPRGFEGDLPPSPPEVRGTSQVVMSVLAKRLSRTDRKEKRT